jgi:hypothetical protein
MECTVYLELCVIHAKAYRHVHAPAQTLIGKEVRVQAAVTLSVDKRNYRTSLLKLGGLRICDGPLCRIFSSSSWSVRINHVEYRLLYKHHVFSQKICPNRATSSVSWLRVIYRSNKAANDTEGTILSVRIHQYQNPLTIEEIPKLMITTAQQVLVRICHSDLANCLHPQVEGCASNTKPKLHQPLFIILRINRLTNCTVWSWLANGDDICI